MVFDKKNFFIVFFDVPIVAHYKPHKVTTVQEFRSRHQGFTVEATVALRLNQGLRKKRAVHRFFLDFFCYFFVSKPAPIHRGQKSKETSPGAVPSCELQTALSHNYSRTSRRHQGLTVEATVAPQLNQGVCTAVLYPPPCLNFLVLFLSREKVHKQRFLSKHCSYFLCLDAKKVTKKNQGQPETLRAFVRLTLHISLQKNEFAPSK